MTGFYELLQVSSDVSLSDLRAAYHDQVAQVVRRQRAAEARQQDTTPLESRRAALAEAWEVLSDPVRRRRYDRFRALVHAGLPTDVDSLWAAASASFADPAAAAAIEVIRTLTDDLRVESMQPPAPTTSRPTPARPRPAEVDSPSVAPVGAPRVIEAPPVERPTPAPRPPMAVERPFVVDDRPSGPTERPPAAADRPTAPTDGASAPPERPSAPAERAPVVTERPSSSSARPPVTPTATTTTTVPPELRTTRGLGGPTEPLELARQVSAEDLARLLDQYGTSGAFLAAVRERRRVKIERLSEVTRITARFIEAIERDLYADLPNATFVRGYLKLIVRELEAIPTSVEAEEYIDGFMARFTRARG